MIKPLLTSKQSSLVWVKLFLGFYKLILSPIITGVNLTVFGYSSGCIHHPTCSQYFASSVERYGIIQGGVKGLKRLLSCQNIYHS